MVVPRYHPLLPAAQPNLLQREHVTDLPVVSEHLTDILQASAAAASGPVDDAERLSEMALSSSLLQALTIALNSKYVSNSTRVAASTTCAALRQPALRQTLCHQGPRQGRPQRRRGTAQGLEAQALAGRRAATKLGGGSSGGSSSGSGAVAWQPLATELDARRPESAWHEFIQLLEQGILPPCELCDRLISGECGSLAGSGMQLSQGRPCIHVLAARAGVCPCRWHTLPCFDWTRFGWTATPCNGPY